MNSSLGQDCINVTDLERSIRFYVEGLGLEVHSRTDVSEKIKGAIVWWCEHAVARAVDTMERDPREVGACRIE